MQYQCFFFFLNKGTMTLKLLPCLQFKNLCLLHERMLWVGKRHAWICMWLITCHSLLSIFHLVGGKNGTLYKFEDSRGSLKDGWNKERWLKRKLPGIDWIQGKRTYCFRLRLCGDMVNKRKSLLWGEWGSTELRIQTSQGHNPCEIWRRKKMILIS